MGLSGNGPKWEWPKWEWASAKWERTCSPLATSGPAAGDDGVDGVRSPRSRSRRPPPPRVLAAEETRASEFVAAAAAARSLRSRTMRRYSSSDLRP